MADALISPTVGGAMWAATGGLTAHCAKKIKEEADDESKVPLMGVLGAFIFSAQMINFSIPGTGSSGHLGGGMILAILLGPYAAFLTIASVITVQALFFADGGLMALGCNIFNMGFFPCFVAYPLVYKCVVRERPTQRWLFLGTMFSGVLALQLGASSVVLETVCSRISDLPVSTFLLLMLPIHLAIGVVEGLVTFAVINVVWKTRPELLDTTAPTLRSNALLVRRMMVGLGLATLITAGFVSWFASSNPDGLEWSLLHATGKTELMAQEGRIATALGHLQRTTTILPGYDFEKSENELDPAVEKAGPASAIRLGTSAAGLLGATLTLSLIGVLAFGLRRLQAVR